MNYNGSKEVTVQCSDKSHKWLCKYLGNCDQINIPNKDFMIAYIKDYKAAHSVNMIGVVKSQQLSKD